MAEAVQTEEEIIWDVAVNKIPILRRPITEILRRESTNQ